MLAQTIDDSVEGFVRHRLAFITAPLKDHGVWSFPLELIEEGPHQRRLAHAGVAMNINCDRPPIASRSERVAQSGELALTPDELGLGRGRKKRCGHNAGS